MSEQNKYPKYYKFDTGFYKLYQEKAVAVFEYSPKCYHVVVYKSIGTVTNIEIIGEPSTEAEFTNAARKVQQLLTNELSNVGKVSQPFDLRELLIANLMKPNANHDVHTREVAEKIADKMIAASKENNFTPQLEKYPRLH